MARIDSGSSSSAAAAARQAAAEAAKRAAAEAAKKAAEAAKKKAAEAAAKKKAAADARRKDGFDPKKHLPKLDKNYDSSKQKDLQKLGNGKGTSKLNADGSQTTTLEQSKKGTTTKEELTTKRNKWTGESQLKFESTSTTKTSANNSRETKHKYEAQTDLLGRTTSTQSKDVAIKKGNTTTTDSRATATDQYGGKKVTTGTSKAVETGDTTVTDSRATTKGRFDTRQVVTEHKTEVKDGNATTTTSKKSTTGTDFSLSHSKGYEDGKFTLKDSADWKKNSFNTEASKEKEWKLKEPAADTGFSQKKTTGTQAGLDKAQKVGDMLGAAGLKKEWKGAEWDTAKLKELEAEKVSFAGSKVGTSGSSSLSIGADGVKGEFKREAVAGLYAQKNDSVTGKYGTASYQAGAKLEAKAGVDAKGTLNLNGLDATVNARVGVTAEASVKGKVESASLAKIGGVDVKVGAEGTARVAAEAEAHATGTAKITRNPPTAILDGSVGASAVVKAEAEVKVSAGPFAVKASGYASAGAEAKAAGTIGYQDGKLKIGGSVGAALGVGLGGSVAVEVDVKQIGEMAKGAADRNGDGKLGLDDVSAGAAQAGQAVAKGVTNAASAAASTVSNAAKTVRSWLPW